METQPTSGASAAKLTVKEQFHANLVTMNSELMLRSMHQHELTEVALSSNIRLQKEISERKQMEAALRESEKRYRALFDFGPVAIYSCDASGVIQKFNRRAGQLWGRKPGAIDRFCGSVKMFGPDGKFVPHQQCPMADVLSGKKAAVHNAEVIVERHDGSRINVVVDIRPLKNKRGEITGAINCFYDITAHKKAEQADRRVAVLAATNRKLEREIASRHMVKKALKSSEQEQDRLLTESRHIRDQLRLLSRQLLLAQEEERKRISRDLHDVIAQTLTGITLRLATLKGDSTMNTKDRERNITRMEHLIGQAVNVVHQFARELRPTVLDDVGLIPALQSFIKTFKEETGIQVSLSAYATVEHVKADKRIVFYRIVQEALTNVARHARATRVQIRIQQLAGAICMKIKDNGKGLPAEGVGGGRKNWRLGLLGMRERLEMVGGTFAIQSAQGKGTTVTAQIPLGHARGGMAGGEIEACHD